MKTKAVGALLLLAVALALIVAQRRMQIAVTEEEPSAPRAESATSAESSQESRLDRTAAAPQPNVTPASKSPVTSPVPPNIAGLSNKAQRLGQIRETFRALAGGDPGTALRSAKQLTDATERETALLALLTEWKQGELNPPLQRAWAIATYGLEAGLGLDLTRHPDLAVVWANELTDGPGRTAILAQTAIWMTESDPAGALALSRTLPPDEAGRFLGSFFAGWAQNDTEAALQWGEQLPDDGERSSALQAIRAVAPVGIGAELSYDNGYPVVRSLVPGNSAELSGQLRPGDRIVAVAQGDNAFVEVGQLSLSDVVQMVRGAPGTVVQLRVQPADTPSGSAPQTISIVRGQIKFKR